MARLVFFGLNALLGLAFSMPGCGKGKALQAPQLAEGPPGLAVGAMAPEIAGEDIDGAFFRLSDYRGKVVLLDFWGNW
jgi:hypothetical protein